jgi:endonuclease-3
MLWSCGQINAALCFMRTLGQTGQQCLDAVAAMAEVYGLPSLARPAPKQRPNLLDALVGTILSQNTTDVNSKRAFASLKAALPTWSAVLESPPEVMIEAIRSGGLAEIKTERVLVILRTLVEEGHVSPGGDEPTLDHLWALNSADAKAAIVRFNGVGPKTAACVLLFAMRRAEFPVDTHVWKIALKMGWVPPAATRESAYAHLNRRVPPELRFDLHCLLVEHGKREKNSLGCLAAVKAGHKRQEVATSSTTKEPAAKKMKKGK